MALKFVTLTGADETVGDPGELVQISREFPFVEWGILVGSQTGTRFPPWYWMRDLLNAVEESGVPVNLSLHICGKWLVELAISQPRLLAEFPEAVKFQRCQLNFHGERWGNVGGHVCESFKQIRRAGWKPQIIFQFDGKNADLLYGSLPDHDVAALFDVSHGAGVLPDHWPQAGVDWLFGFAGGLGPDNVVEQLPKITERANPAGWFWIDMETKLFTTADEMPVGWDGPPIFFDLNKCRAVLEAVRGTGVV